MHLRRFFIAIAMVAGTAAGQAQTTTISVQPAEQGRIIPAEIYGHFAEHLGTCIYGGLWVGEDSPIPNTCGYRNDVLEALKELHIPVLRWPGGCFADEYHWRDGIGPRSQRPTMVNSNWGGTVEDNSFGTHEFFNLCELLGAEPYLSGNVGSGTVEEMAKWVEYITAADGPMADLRRQNGRDKPWHLKYLGVGNESWGCGGNFTAEAYADVYRRYQTYCRDFNGNHLFKVASGANEADYHWTETLMDRARHHMHGISMHFYATDNWSDHGSATQFAPTDYYNTLAYCLKMEELVSRHSEIMDRFDPQRRIALMVDEWGTWWNEEPGTIRGHLHQQNTMRDAMVAVLTLNIFHRHTERVRMANIAQIANVLQSMVLTQGDKMVVTPTYHVFRMYTAHQNAAVVPLTIDTPMRDVEGRASVPMVTATASTKDGVLTISLANTDLDREAQVIIDLGEWGIYKSGSVQGELLSADRVQDCNDYDNPNRVAVRKLKPQKIKNGRLLITIPKSSVASYEIRD